MCKNTVQTASGGCRRTQPSWRLGILRFGLSLLVLAGCSRAQPPSYTVIAEGIDDRYVYVLLKGPKPGREPYAVVDRGRVDFFVDHPVKAGSGAVQVRVEPGPGTNVYKLSVQYGATDASNGVAVFLDGRSLGPWKTAPAGPAKR